MTDTVPHETAVASELDALDADDLRALVESSRLLVSELNPTKLLRRILGAASRLTDSPDGAVLLLDESKNALYFADACGEHAAMLLAAWGVDGTKRVPLVGSKAGEVYTSTTTAVVEAVEADPNHFKGVDSATHERTASMVCVPLLAPDRATGGTQAIGVIQILNKRDGNYTARDRTLLERFAEQAAIAIDNARLIADLYASKGLYFGDDDSMQPPKMLARPAWKETLTVLVADMRGFTQLCQVVGSAERTQVLLNEFLDMLACATIDHKGVVNKFLGDGVMAFFRNHGHATAAVSAAFEMLRAFDAMKTKWDDATNASLAFLDLGIGISTEEVILGSLGSPRVRDFTAIGIGVNLAQNLMERARDGRRLMVDKMTFRSAQDLVAEHTGPESFDLGRPGQAIVHPYQCYHLVQAKGVDGATPRRAAPERPPTPRKGAVFISYSRHDAAWLRMLQTHLSPYLTAGSLEIWDDSRTKPGDDWRVELDRALTGATVALFIVTPDLLASPFILDVEIRPLLQKARGGGTRILWLPAKSSSYEETAFESVQAVLNPARPLDLMSEAEQHLALVNVCKLVKSAFDPR